MFSAGGLIQSSFADNWPVLALVCVLGTVGAYLGFGRLLLLYSHLVVVGLPRLLVETEGLQTSILRTFDQSFLRLVRAGRWLVGSGPFADLLLFLLLRLRLDNGVLWTLSSNILNKKKK